MACTAHLTSLHVLWTRCRNCLLWIIHACAQTTAHTEEWIEEWTASYKEMERSSKIKEEGITAEGHFLRPLTAGETPTKSIWKGKKLDVGGRCDVKRSPVTPQPPPPHAFIKILQFLKWFFFFHPHSKNALRHIIFTRGRRQWRADGSVSVCSRAAGRPSQTH